MAVTSAWRAPLLPTLVGIRVQPPSAYRLEAGGTVEDSARGQDWTRVGMPLLLIAKASLLMLHLRNFEMKSRSIIGSGQFLHRLAACRATQVTSNPELLLGLI